MVQVFLPVAKPGIAAAAMFAFMSAWGEFLFALVFSSTSASKPLTVAVSELATDISIQYTLMATSGVIAIIVPLCLALLFQRLIVQGLVAGSVKG
jgi:multiple sugar transport system permease protein